MGLSSGARLRLIELWSEIALIELRSEIALIELRSEIEIDFSERD